MTDQTTPNPDVSAHEEEPEVFTDLRYVRDTIDGETVLSLREVVYTVIDPGYPDVIDVLDVADEPVQLTGDSIQAISRLLDKAGLARFKEIIPGITAWRLEHRDDTHGLLFNVHEESACAGENCTIHHRSDHHMRSFPQNWRGDAGFMERTCPHGVSHPDPDELPRNRDRVHGCCWERCCVPPDQRTAPVDFDQVTVVYLDPNDPDTTSRTEPTEHDQTTTEEN